MINFIIVTISVSLILFGYVTNNVNLAFFATILILSSNIIYALKKIRNRYLFMVFNSTFFIFIMGRITMNFIFYGNIGLNYDNEIVMHTVLSIYISLITVFLTFLIVNNMKFKKVKIKQTFSKRIDVEVLRKASKLVFYATYIFALLTVVEKIYFVMHSGYAAYYIVYNSSLLGIVIKLATVNEIAFFFYLASHPIKKDTKVIFFLYLLIGILSLGFGQRNEVVLRICLVYFIYYPYRNLIREIDDEKWITRSYIRNVVIAIPALIFFMSFWGMVRAGVADKTSIGDHFISFFYNQGNSAEIIAFAKYAQNQIPNHLYSLGPISEFLRSNILSKYIFNTQVYTGFTIDAAMIGTNFGSTLSYLYNPSHYIQGIGLGSCYIAELYHDFGFLGVIFINVVYAFFIAKFGGRKIHGAIKEAIYLMILYNIIYAPRDRALSFITNLFSFTFILTAFLIWFAYTHYKTENIHGSGKSLNVN